MEGEIISFCRGCDENGEIESTSLAFQMSVLPLHHVGALMSPLASEDSGYHLTCLPGIISLLMLTLTYTQAMASYVCTQGRFNNHTAHSLYRIMVMGISVVGMMKMGNVVPTALCLEQNSNPHLWNSGPVSTM